MPRDLPREGTLHKKEDNLTEWRMINDALFHVGVMRSVQTLYLAIERFPKEGGVGEVLYFHGFGVDQWKTGLHLQSETNLKNEIALAGWQWLMEYFADKPRK